MPRVAVTRRVFLVTASSALLVGCAPNAPTASMPPGVTKTTYTYGDDPQQACDLHLPAEPNGNTVILVHGGFWRSGYDRTLENAIAADLVARSYTVWNIDYRGTGGGGGNPETFEDVARAVDALGDIGPAEGVDLARVAIVGHSAGGHLALWAAGRHTLTVDDVGADPHVGVIAAVSQAGVNDLVAAHDEALGGDAAGALLGLGGDEDVPTSLADATSPAQMVPLGVPQLIVTGALDNVVPVEYSENYAEAAETTGDDITLEIVDDEGHNEHLDPASASWEVASEWLDAQFGVQ